MGGDWKAIYAAKGVLRVYEVAWIMLGMRPPVEYPDERYIEYDSHVRMLNLIEDLAASGEIKIRRTMMHEDGRPYTWLLEQSSVLEWCRKSGRKWPLEGVLNDMVESSGYCQAPQDSIVKQSEGCVSLEKEVECLRKEVEVLKEKLEKLELFAPLHPGGLMGLAIKVQHEYWRDPDNARPKAEVIVKTLMHENKSLSNAKAKAVEAVACPIER